MTDRKYLFENAIRTTGLLVMLLAIGLLIVGCNLDQGEEPDVLESIKGTYVLYSSLPQQTIVG